MQEIMRTLVLPLALAAAVGVAVLGSAGAQEKKDKDKKPAAAATAVFELYVDTADEFRFRLKDAEGVLLVTSGKGYRTKADCQEVIDTIRSTAARACGSTGPRHASNPSSLRPRTPGTEWAS
jgi:uncharacterized protein YegP (UPF0339 family)